MSIINIVKIRLRSPRYSKVTLAQSQSPNDVSEKEWDNTPGNKVTSLLRSILASPVGDRNSDVV